MQPLPWEHKTCNNDALIMKMEAMEGNHWGLPSKVEGYKYHINIFNDGSTYAGWII